MSMHSLAVTAVGLLRKHSSLPAMTAPLWQRPPCMPLSFLMLACDLRPCGKDRLACQIILAWSIHTTASKDCSLALLHSDKPDGILAFNIIDQTESSPAMSAPSWQDCILACCSYNPSQPNTQCYAPDVPSH
jgi:hypothetical protein